MARASRWLIVFVVAATMIVTSGGTCLADDEVQFTILHTGDEHSALIPHSPAVDRAVGGFSRLAGEIGRLRAELNEPVLLLSSGDFTAGTVFTWLALERMAPELMLMMEMGYDVITLGNHEFDYGPEHLADYLAAAGYPDRDLPRLVASNIQVPEGHPLGERGISEYTIMEVAGIRVGVFGLMGSDAIRVMADPDPVSFAKQHDTARLIVDQLQQEGVDVIVAITHSGVNEDRALAEAVPGIHVIVGGHCHTALSEPVIEGTTIIVQSGAHTAHLGVLHLTYHRNDGTVSVRNDQMGQQFLIPLDESAVVDPYIGELVSDYVVLASELLFRLTGGEHSYILDTIARADFDMHRRVKEESALGNLVTDAMRSAVAELGVPVDIAFQANGQLRAHIIPGRTLGQLGRLSVYDVVGAVGLGKGPDGSGGYPIVQVYLTGDEIRRVLEISTLLSGLLGDSYFLQVSGLSYSYDPGRAVLLWIPIKNLPLPTYKSVTRASLDNGEALRWGDERLYAVVTDIYVASFVPQVGDLLPRLAIVPKDEHGRPITDLEDRIVYQEGRELKVWQAVLSYLGGMEAGMDGIAVVPGKYAHAEGRQVVVKTVPLLVWYGGAGVLVLGGLVVLIRRAWRRRRARRVGRRA